jgi:4a-hydroxytetrahydrobiopterin dehydratase
MDELSQKKCIPCSKGTPPLTGERLKDYQKKLSSDWKVIDEKRLEKEYNFKNFIDALAFTNQIGAIAEQEGHHPDIFLTWGKVKLIWWTHKIGGLSESDFIMAAKSDALI